MPSDTSSSSSSIQSSKKKSPAENQYELPDVSNRKQASVKEISISYLRHRLCVREHYYARLALVSNLMSFLAIVGVILMIIENELTFAHVNNKDTKVSWFLKLIITITTVILLVLIFYYHYLDMSLYSLRNTLEDWRVELTNNKILLIILEISICAVHPMPRSYPQLDPEKLNSTSIESDSSSPNLYSLSYTAVDVGLGLPMFLRLYLLGRSIMLHSHVIRDISLRSLGYLNKVSIDYFYIIKTFLEQWPRRCLITFCIIVFFIGSWSLRACDYTTTRERLSMLESMWLFITTFTTIGYGDLYPSTYCGRGIATIIGLIGLLLSAIIIAILTQKLFLTREEKYVHTFVLNTQLEKKRKNQAANVIKFVIKVWYLKRRNKSSSIEYLLTQRKIFRSIYHLQKIRQDQRNLIDSCVNLTDVMTIHRDTSVQTRETVQQIVIIKNDIKKIEEELKNINYCMNTLQNTLNILLDRATK
ncbi:unnamed protein product [Rotaria sordida]|uniref:Calmodulin-binding domain-containing protein n=1 Tax=Rotaria sordida TaxID=392033 RepID=A0A814ENS6_9BILA|nr:unnamed protein product [Rotaria sordida]